MNTQDKSEITSEPQDELSRCKQERDDYLAGWQRAKADLLNYKKEEAARLEEFAKYHSADFVLELVSVLDNFDLGLTALERRGPVEKGIYMIRAHLEDILKKRGLSRIEVKAGDEFSPAVMEAIAEVDSELPAGRVVDEVEAGYRLHGRILRPARVKISRGRAQNA